MKKTVVMLISMVMLLANAGTLPANAEADQDLSPGGSVGYYIPYSVIGHIKPEYEELAQKWDTVYISDALSVEYIFSIMVNNTDDVPNYLDRTFDRNASSPFEHRTGVFLEVDLNLNESEKEKAIAAYEALKKADWFDEVKASWAPRKDSSPSLPLQLPIEEDFTCDYLDVTVKSDYSQDKERWNESALNESLGISNIKDVETLFMIDASQRLALRIYLYDNSKEAAFSTAQKLYETGCFYSVSCVDKNIQPPTKPGLDPSPTNPPIIWEEGKGDVNQDGTVDIMDVIVVNKAVLGIVELTEPQKIVADVDRNQKVDASDSLMILKEAIGITENYTEH